MTRDAERYIAKLRKTADMLDSLPTAGPDFADANRLVSSLRWAAQAAIASDIAITKAEKLIEKYTKKAAA